MSKLQNNFTTSEQSKRLLELGIPTNSADCYYNDRFCCSDWQNASIHIRQCISEIESNFLRMFALGIYILAGQLID